MEFFFTTLLDQKIMARIKYIGAPKNPITPSPIRIDTMNNIAVSAQPTDNIFQLNGKRTVAEGIGERARTKIRRNKIDFKVDTHGLTPVALE